jgi:hypothetical protein
MKRLHTLLVLLLGLSSPALADIWKWVDADGNTHFVDSETPIFTWVDDYGKRHYSDTPDHEDAVSVELVWHSEGTLEDLANEGGGKESAAEESGDESGGYAYPGETERRGDRGHDCRDEAQEGAALPLNPLRYPVETCGNHLKSNRLSTRMM